MIVELREESNTTRKDKKVLSHLTFAREEYVNIYLQN